MKNNNYVIRYTAIVLSVLLLHGAAESWVLSTETQLSRLETLPPCIIVGYGVSPYIYIR